MMGEEFSLSFPPYHQPLRVCGPDFALSPTSKIYYLVHSSATLYFFFTLKFSILEAPTAQLLFSAQENFAKRWPKPP